MYTRILLPVFVNSLPFELDGMSAFLCFGYTTVEFFLGYFLFFVFLIVITFSVKILVEISADFSGSDKES